MGVLTFSVYKITSYYTDEYRSQQQLGKLQSLYYAPATMAVPSAQEQSPVPSPSPTSRHMPDQPEADELSPLVANEPAVQEHFLPLLEKNDDIVGWLSITETLVDYPVLQSDDNEFYLTRDIEKNDNVNGSIFMDYRNTIETPERHTILYGHNMKNKTMFASLLNYESRWYFENHPIITFDTLYENRQWQIFSAYFTDTDDKYLQTDFKDAAAFGVFLGTIQNKSLHHSDVILSEKDSILTLSTCSTQSSDGRFVVHAKLIDTKNDSLD